MSSLEQGRQAVRPRVADSAVWRGWHPRRLKVPRGESLASEVTKRQRLPGEAGLRHARASLALRCSRQEDPWLACHAQRSALPEPPPTTR